MFGLSVAYARALVPRSVTTPIALSIARLIDGDPSLTAVLVIVSGVVGALAARPLLERLGFDSPIALGVATGAASHGIGTAALLREAPRAAALSGIAFALTASISVALVSLPPVRGLLLLLTG
jgi:putative effector of murein hydrolase